MSSVLEVEGLRVVCHGASGPVLATDDVNLVVNRGEVVGIIGESGSGKTTLVRSLIGLLGRNCSTLAGRIRFDGRTILSEDIDELRTIRGSHVGMIFQNAAGSLNPLLKIGPQLREVLRAHTDLGREAIDQRMHELLELLGFEDPRRVLGSYPHQLSGGMSQRVAIAIAVATEPTLVIADECTSAIDVTTQAEVVDLLRQVTRDQGWSLLFVTHDILLATELCSRLVVMYGGQIVEDGPVDLLVTSPRHPYTRALLDAVPLWQPRAELRGIQGAPQRVRPGFVGCRFAGRCPRRRQQCSVDNVAWATEAKRGHRCLFPIDTDLHDERPVAQR